MSAEEVPPEVHGLLERSRAELAAARALVTQAFSAQAVTHAYYAAFFAAEGALLSLGETRSKHSGVIGAFGQLIVKGGGVEPATGRILRDLYELRQRAVYDGAKVEEAHARSAIADAERFVDAVVAWLARH